MHTRVWLKQRKFIFSQSWRPEVPDQGLARWISGEGSLPGLLMAAFLPCLHKAEGERELALWCLLFKDFFLMWTILKSLSNLLQYCFCFMFCFFRPEACGILAPNQGLNRHSLHWKVKSEPLDRQGTLLCLSYKGTDPTGFGSQFTTSFNLNVFLIPHIVSLRGRASTYECWKDRI